MAAHGGTPVLGTLVTLDPLRPTGWWNRSADAPAPHAARRWSQRGQSLVELAMLLPILLLLVVIALDFGRIYLGYINIQNMARIAANHAANNPLAWSVTIDADVQERYRNQILEDTTATNCHLPVAGGVPVIPDPVFTDIDLDGSAVGLGDRVTVQLTCEFSVITPLIGNILGGTVDVTAESNFPVKAGMTSVVAAGGGSGGGGGVTSPPSAAFIANNAVFSTDATPVVTVVGPAVIVDFRDASGGGSPIEWLWSFGDGVTSTSQDVAHEYDCTVPDAYGYCSYLVEMTATNTYGSSTAYMSVLVRGDSDVNFTADRQVIDRGQSVAFTDASTPGGTDFAWTFGAGEGAFNDATGTATHTYNTAGTFTVTLTVTYPAPVGVAPTAVKTGFITVNPGYCPVPVLKDVRFNTASDPSSAVSPWKAAGFTGAVNRAAGANPGNFLIKSQSIAGGTNAFAICSSDVYVSDLSTAIVP
jgi:PKD repeat protein